MGDQKTGSGGKRLKRQSVESLCYQKKPSLHFWFQFLLLLCLLVFILCFYLFNLTLSWQEKFLLHRQQWFFNKSNQVNVSAYKVHPKHKAVIPEIYKTTGPPTVHPEGIQYHQAYPRNYRFIIDNPETCQKETPFLVLMVPVEPSNVQAWDAIRQTWGNESLVQGQLVATLFMLGRSGEDDSEKLKQENLQHHDLIQSDFMDTYVNLTIKTMVIMDWLTTRCRNATYTMKVDSDMFLNIDNLVIMLKKAEIPTKEYLTGNIMWNIPVIRSKDSKWYVPEEMFPDSKYPTYTMGMGYIFSNDLPEKFVEVSKMIKPFNIEDAYIGMCMKKLELELTPPPNPSQFKTYNTKYNRCEYSQIITYILGSPQELVNYWTDLKKPGPHC
ncbi:beta-1,3-galactosyltransferase 2-like [Melanotaenia boesemani]|uniref:beta-1,3-galactosyltransferase 2-like n=1 Tax=Melanotaenia boesemani TaxID=1250792 RepID=UPI001C0457D9|nr:beta-1,3-galactosyltransferase 2-like [Melanotaenia boesemani]